MSFGIWLGLGFGFGIGIGYMQDELLESYLLSLSRMYPNSAAGMAPRERVAAWEAPRSCLVRS